MQENGLNELGIPESDDEDIEVGETEQPQTEVESPVSNYRFNSVLKCIYI